METIHAIRRNGTILKGTEALKELYDTVDLGWAARIGDLPVISTVSCVWSLSVWGVSGGWLAGPLSLPAQPCAHHTTPTSQVVECVYELLSKA